MSSDANFTSTETVGLLGTGAQDGLLDFHTAPELWHGKISGQYTFLTRGSPPPTPPSGLSDPLCTSSPPLCSLFSRVLISALR